MTEALSAATAAVEGKMSKKLKSVLKKVVATEAHEQLAVADAKLGNTIKEKLNLSCVTSTAIQELMRCIRGQIENLLEGFPEKEMAAMSLGLAHSLSRYKLKFSPDKVDTMIIQAVSLLDDLDKELNNYVMRCKEWYGWHFPELSKLITDNTTYIKTVLAIGMRSNAASANLDDVVPEELQGKLRELAEISIGTEISEEDIFNILQLGREVLEMQEYRAKLYEYLKNRMMAIAPNLTVLVGDLVGARLISHAGSLLSLAKHPASTVQILGAEKALFRALKTKHDTPKYGLIYHAQLVGMSNSRIKGKVSRMLAAKAALACRVDALGEDVNQDLGIEHRAKLEARLKFLEEGGMRRLSGSGKGRGKFDRYEHKSRVHTFEDRHDVTIGKKRKFDPEGAAGESPMPKKIKAEPIEEQAAGDSSALMEASEAPEGMGSEKKKKKKKIKQEPEEAQEPEEETMQVPVPEEAGEEMKSEKKKKKKKSKEQDEEDD